MNVKQMMLGTPLGRAAMFAREKASLLHTSVTRPEALAAQLNDNLATRLATQLPCRTFVDVGAHLGSVVAAVRQATAAKVIAFEAMPDKAAALARRFPDVTVHACALGDADGTASFFVVPAASGYSSLIKSAESVEIEVPLRRLDDLVTEHVDTIKVDVEGAELGVLRGAERLISEFRPLIMFESAPGEAMYTKAAMWEWCNEHQYQIVTPDRMAHEGPSLTRDGFVDSHYYPRRTTNYFAIPAEKRNMLRSQARELLGIVTKNDLLHAEAPQPGESFLLNGACE